MTNNGDLSRVFINSQFRWNRIFGERLTASTIGENRYVPIPTKTYTTNHRFNIVGVRSLDPNTNPNWRLGAKVGLMSAAAIDSGAGVAQLIEYGSFFAPLGRYTWIEAPGFDDVNEYAIELRIPRWLKDVFVEGFWYDETVEPEYIERLDEVLNLVGN